MAVYVENNLMESVLSCLLWVPGHGLCILGLLW
jgi:hypothetical protein